MQRPDIILKTLQIIKIALSEKKCRTVRTSFSFDAAIKEVIRHFRGSVPLELGLICNTLRLADYTVLAH